MPSHPIDYQIQSYIFSTQESLQIFDEKARFQRWLNFEAALAESQGEMGIIPAEAAQQIKSKATLAQIDLTIAQDEYTRNRNSLTPILKALKKSCGSEYGQYVHYGTTTQDVIDTGQIIELKEVLHLMYRDLRQIEKQVLNLAEQHKDTAMIGRTHSQQAIPITFGLKAAVWTTEIRRNIERLKSLSERVLIGQCSGAVGSMAALGSEGREVAKRTLAKLGLTASITPWHTSRDNMAEVASFFAICTGTLAKIANEIFQLGKTEILELREPAPAGKTSGSSTMPHKRNPVIAERIVVLSRHVRSLSGIIMEGMIHENERDPRALWSEWLAFPQICIYTVTALSYLQAITDGLEVFPENMRKNLYIHKEVILSEWLLFTLGRKIGKSKAQEKITLLMQKSAEEKETLKTLLTQDKETAPHLNEAELQKLDSPELYTGLSSQIVNDVINDLTPKRNNDPATLNPLR